MRHIDDARKRLRRSGVRRHHLGAVKDPNNAILDEDLDVVSRVDAAPCEARQPVRLGDDQFRPASSCCSARAQSGKYLNRVCVVASTTTCGFGS
jgi:hypothetical protein